MSSISKILIVLDVYNDYRDDPSHQPSEIKKSLEMISHNKDAEIFLVGCGFEEYLHDNYSNFGPEALVQRKQFCAEMESRLQVFADTLSKNGYKVDCRVHWTYPRFEQIAKETIDLDVDLVVQHVHTQRSTEQHNLSHDSWQLVKTCKKPLLLIKERPWSEHCKVMAAVDPVHAHHKPQGLDHQILGIAASTVANIDGELHVVHAYSGTARPFANIEEIHSNHNQAMDQLLSEYEIAEDNIHLIDETPANAILKTQKSIAADIVVLGALSRSRISEAIIGNTADKVLDYINSDLYIIKPE